ncbi:dephospho-CoA kinase [Hellea balneolensis]|uniref:dephospho-CoA kinase n=1 Tax=Hellea balneolensis TaxID=287478 RepID=UPI00047BA1FA|nr:dephospho-CoA kinase [Hellea balneolensis]
MIIIGLTGSIGMGKSTTAEMFREEGYPVFDADGVVHELYAKGGKAVPIIKAVFPDAIKNGAVDRVVLGAHMRADPLHLKVLESFIHPLVSESRTAFFEAHKDAKIVVMDVPLLFETGLDKAVHHIAVVTAPYQLQRERVLAREGMTPELFDSLLARQIPDDEKRKRADVLIFTDKGLDNARKQVQDIIRDLKETA